MGLHWWDRMRLGGPAQRALLLCLVATSASHAQDTGKREQDVRAVCEWIVFTDDPRLHAFVTEFSKSALKVMSARHSDNFARAAGEALRKLQAAYDSGARTVKVVARDYKTPVVREATEVFKSTIERANSACVKCIRILEETGGDQKRLEKRQEEFVHFMLRAVVFAPDTQSQGAKVHAGAQRAWGTLKLLAANAPQAERDAREVCAWMLYETEWKGRVEAVVQQALQNVGHARAGTRDQVRKALAAARDQCKRSVSTLTAIARPYKSTNVTAASRTTIKTLQNIALVSGRCIQLIDKAAANPSRAAKYAAGIEEGLELLANVTFDTPEERDIAKGIAKRVLGR